MWHLLRIKNSFLWTILRINFVQEMFSFPIKTLAEILARICRWVNQPQYLDLLRALLGFWVEVTPQLSTRMHSNYGWSVAHGSTWKVCLIKNVKHSPLSRTLCLPALHGKTTAGPPQKSMPLPWQVFLTFKSPNRWSARVWPPLFCS